MLELSFVNKTALVTGGAGGIGRATALAFAAAGAHVVVCDIAPEGAAQTVALIQAAGGSAHAVVADVTQAEQVAALIDNATAVRGRLDCAFNNAGIEEETLRLADSDEGLFDRMMAVNVKGVWLCMKHELRQMLQQGGGAIVNTASVAGLIGAPRHAIYAASKHAVIGLTRSAAAEYGKKRIRVNAVCPGVIRTAMLERVLARDPAEEANIVRLHPVGRIGTVDEVAATVLWLCSDHASFVTGHAHTVDGGMTAV